MSKTLRLVLVLGLALVLVACGDVADKKEGEKSNITIEQVNEFLNTSGGLGPGSIGNVVQVVPHAHIDGPKNETPFYAFVNFKYKARDYVKYQVTFLSCTCRSAAVNYWQTAYIELSLPSSKDKKDAVLRTISFDQDANGDYMAGFWGDSNPTPAGRTYEDFKREYLPYFIGKTGEQIKAINTMWDIAEADYQTGEGREGFKIDAFTGSSVSANNIVRILHSVIDYHATDEFFAPAK